jgi:hypothetical protein
MRIGYAGGSLVNVRVLVSELQRVEAAVTLLKQAAISITSLASVYGSLFRIAVKQR